MGLEWFKLFGFQCDKSNKFQVRKPVSNYLPANKSK